MHAFFRFFWPISLISSRWACEFEPQVLAWVGCSISLCLRPVGLFVCLFVCLCVCPFYKTVVNIRRFSLVHYQKVVNIRRFSLSHYKKVMNIRRLSLPYFKKVMNNLWFPLVHYQTVVNIRRFSFSSPNSDEYSKFFFEPQLLAWVGCSISLCVRPVGLFVCLFVYVFVRFTKQWLILEGFR